MKIVNGKKFYAADIKAARRIDGNGWDSECLMLISDYYGGGCASMATFFDDCNQYYSISDTILNLILDTLHCSEAATKDTLLIVEIR